MIEGLTMDKEEALSRLRELAECDDQEIAHKEADKVLTDFLRALGHGDLAEAFDAIDKWYS
jgi:hypothetical protein